MAAGKEWLEDLLGEEVVSFAYPHGAYDAETMRLVEEIGLTSGCTTERGATHRGCESLCAAAYSCRRHPIDVFEERLEQICGTSATMQ